MGNRYVSIVCRECNRVRWHQARGLCSGCYSRVVESGRVGDFPTGQRDLADSEPTSDLPRILKTCYGISGVWFRAGTPVREVWP